MHGRGNNKGQQNLIITNGRREKINMGPRGTLAISDMKPIAGYSSDGGGSWREREEATGNAHTFIFAKDLTREKRIAVYPTRTFTCPECNTEATRLFTAIYCSDRCRGKVAKRESRARAKAKAQGGL